MAAVALSALPATAGAATRKATGQTSAGEPVTLWVRADNSVSLVKFKWEAKCRAPGFTWRDKLYFRDRPEGPFKREGAAFSDGGTFKKRYKEGPATFNTRMAGAPSADGGWEGTFSISVRVYNRKGKLTDYCRTGRLTWKAGPPA
jgi:hypothetical protein